ncbi:sigma-70 family RNA polymerase sigma factor [bacterium]|nr:sigma-70 family RNA polymerase sigma factor [bacterium]
MRIVVKEKLIKACIKGERKAQQSLYQYCFQPLLSICMRYKNNKEDGVAILNDAFLKILTNIESLDPSVPFEAWAKRITINCCINDYRKNRSKPSIVSYDDEYVREPSIHAFEIEEEDHVGITLKKLKELLARVPASSQEVFQLYILEGYTHKEIAEILKISEGTSKWHLNNARGKLKEMIIESQNRISRIAL